jgi:hypothetical protein
MSHKNRTTFREAVDKTLADLDIEDADSALIALLYRYADIFDEYEDEETLDRCGTGFLSALKQMGATPVSRGKETTPTQVSKLAELRAAHRKTAS